MRGADWHVLRELLALRAHFNDFFERALLPSSPSAVAPAGRHAPPVDVWEEHGTLVVEMELPGIVAADLDVHIEDGTLVVSGDSQANDPPGCTYLRVERPRGRFSRRIQLPVPVSGTPQASLRHGVLTVTLNAESGARHVEIVHEGVER